MARPSSWCEGSRRARWAGTGPRRAIARRIFLRAHRAHRAHQEIELAQELVRTAKKVAVTPSESSRD